MTILAIDYGEARIGLAISFDVLAEPLMVISNSSKVFTKIDLICRTNKVERIVIGIPDGKIRERIKVFGQKISQKTGLPVTFQDETLTSKEAIAKMIVAGKKNKFRQKKQDMIAATIILENFLEGKKLTSN